MVFLAKTLSLASFGKMRKVIAGHGSDGIKQSHARSPAGETAPATQARSLPGSVFLGALFRIPSFAQNHLSPDRSTSRRKPARWPHGRMYQPLGRPSESCLQAFARAIQNRHTHCAVGNARFARILGKLPQEEAIALQATMFCGKLCRPPAVRRRP
jgi:hypothetical protein